MNILQNGYHSIRNHRHNYLPLTTKHLYKSRSFFRSNYPRTPAMPLIFRNLPTLPCLRHSIYQPSQSTLSVRLKMTVIPRRLNIVHRDTVFRLLRSMRIDALLLLPIPAVVFRGVIDSLVRSSRDKLLLVASARSAVILMMIRSTAANSEHPKDTRCNAKHHC